MRTIVQVKNLSKQYKLGRKQSSSFRDSFRFGNVFSKRKQETFWALNDVSFEIKEGEVLGIIGRNGAGKSTLLKILSRITEPTKGRIEINGRIASLLEVGTGFHPELTGRENIFLNGAILGMKRSEIRKKLDAIVDFSGVEKFIDTPVKHYSSGMYVRLAFAVAAHLEPEILLVDEVLAVGDAEFQQKCLGKMKDVSKQDGRTVLFVSHSMSAVSALCNKAAFLNAGSVHLFGEIDEVVSAYMDTLEKDLSQEQISHAQNEAGDNFARLVEVVLINKRQQQAKAFYVNEEIGIRVAYEITAHQISPKLSIYIHGSLGETILCSIDSIKMENHSGMISKTLWLPPNFFNQGTFSVSVALSTFFPHKLHFYVNNFVKFTIHDKLDAVTRQGFSGPLSGFLRPELEWQLNS